MSRELRRAQRPADGAPDRKGPALPSSAGLQQAVGNRAMARFAQDLQEKRTLARRTGSSVKIGRPISSTDSKAAAAKGQLLGARIKRGEWSTADAEELERRLDFFEGSARFAFVRALGDALGERIEEFEGNERDRKDIYAVDADTSLIVPVSGATVVRGGFKLTYAAQIYEETSDTTGVEVYTDVSGGGEISLSIPIKKVVQIKLGASYRKGRKESQKHESKNAKRTGKTISRTFKVQRVERKVFHHQARKTYHGVSTGTPAIAHRLDYESHGYNPAEIQVGYQIVPEEGGEPWGPFWNTYDGYTVNDGSALAAVWATLTAQQHQIAKDLVFGG